MKTNLFLVVLLFFFLGTSFKAEAQINLNKLKNKAIQKANDKTKDKKTDNSTSQKEEVKSNTTSNTSTSSSTSNQSSKKLSAEQEAYFWTFYQSVTSECEAMVWREGVYEGYFLSMYELKPAKIEKFLFLVNDLEQQIEKDKKITPETFKFYGNKTEMPQGMEYGAANNDALPTKLRAANKYVTKYYVWKANVKDKFHSDLAKNVQTYINQSKQYATTPNQLGFAWRYANTALQFADAFSKLQPNNQEMATKKQEAQTQINAIITALRPKLSGKFQEENLEKVIAFKQKQIVGKENKADIIQEIIPAEPTYLMAYAVDPLIGLGAKSVEGTGNRPRLPKFFLKNLTQKEGDDMEISIYPYCNQEIFNKMKEAYYVEFELFPDLNTTNYASHLNYMPTLHLTEYLLTQPAGTYSWELRFGEDNGEIGPKSKFSVKLTEESKKNLQNYHDQMWTKKLNTVTFNTQYGAGDDRNTVSNWEDLSSKHGKLIKLTVSQTGTVMRPWPNENQVESYVGSGWILVERTDGKYEVIGYSFVKKAGEQKWRVTAVASDMDYYGLFVPSQLGSRVEAKRLEFGYEILKENISKGNVW